MAYHSPRWSMNEKQPFLSYQCTSLKVGDLIAKFVDVKSPGCGADIYRIVQITEREYICIRSNTLGEDSKIVLKDPDANPRVVIPKRTYIEKVISIIPWRKCDVSGCQEEGEKQVRTEHDGEYHTVCDDCKRKISTNGFIMDD
jgi:hypothetical protein